MSLMLLVLLVITGTTVTMVRTAYDNQTASRVAAARAQARLYAAAALEEFFARVSADENFLRDAFFKAPADPSPHPALRAAGEAGEQWALLSMPSGWREGQQVVPTGSTPCPTGDAAFTSDCYYLKLLGPRDNAKLPAVVVVEVTLRTRCAGDEARCVYTRFQQRLRRTQFFEFALAQELATLAPEALFPAGSFDEGGTNREAFLKYRAACANRRGLVRAGVVLTGVEIALGTTDYATGEFKLDDAPETLDVEGCVDMAYQSDAVGGGTDSLTGPVYTADDFVTLCGNLAFDAVYVSGRGWDNDSNGTREAYRFAPSSSCAGSSFSGSSRTRVPMLLQPPSSDVLADAENAGVNEVEVLVKVNPNQPILTEFNGAAVTFTNVTLSTGTDCRARPGGGLECPVDGKVLVVRNLSPSTGSDYASVDLKVSGTVEGMVSLVVEGSVAIVDDLVYENGTVNNTSDVLTLTATERIEIWQSCGDGVQRYNNCTAVQEDRTVHGILTSGLGYVGVPDWQYNTKSGRTQKTLTFFGSIASRYQGVYGAYVDAVERKLVSGFYKNFKHDNLERIENAEERLPFFVETETAVWTRVDVTEVPYRP